MRGDIEDFRPLFNVCWHNKLGAPRVPGQPQHSLRVKLQRRQVPVKEDPVPLCSHAERPQRDDTRRSAVHHRGGLGVRVVAGDRRSSHSVIDDHLCHVTERTEITRHSRPENGDCGDKRRTLVKMRRCARALAQSHV